MYLKETKWYVHTCSSSSVASVIFRISFFGINQEMNWSLWINVLNGYALKIKQSN